MATCVGSGFGPWRSASVAKSTSEAAGARSSSQANVLNPSGTGGRSCRVSLQGPPSAGGVSRVTIPVHSKRAGRRSIIGVISAKGKKPSSEKGDGNRSGPEVKMPPGADGDDWLMRINELFKDNLTRTNELLQDNLTRTNELLLDNLTPIRKDIANLVETTGDLVEVTTRQQIAKMLGDIYVRSLLARSLQDLALLLPEETLFKDAESMEALKAPLERAKRVSRALVESGVALRLLRSLQDGAGQMGWVRADGSLDRRALGSFIGTTDNNALRSKLVRLRRVLELKTKEEQVEELISCESAGIMLLIAAAFPDMYLTGRPGFMPSEEIELDCRGRMDVDKETNFAYIDTGEVKTRVDYATAVPQLGLRLGALKQFVCTACGTKEDGVRLVGRLFVFEKGFKQFTEPNQRVEAATKWNFSLYVHKVGR